MALSKAQQEAIMHFKGPAMVLAGPGSGKTTVITRRADYLIREYKVHPANILVVTFTKAAAQEMKTRFLKLRNETHTAVRFGTFHSVYFEILKYAYHLTGANIAGEDKQYTFLKEIIGKMNLEIEDEADFLKSIMQEISMIKTDRIPLEHFYSSAISDEVFKKIFSAYHDRLEKESLLDYDDLMVYTWELLSQREDILNGWRKRYQYILIDEFQDINKLQYDVIKLLAAPSDNLFIVGDDDQSIYRFRGAKPEIMLRFPKEYPNAVKILLDLNFRCSGNVIQAAGKVIGRNVTRYQKKIHEVKEAGKPVSYLTFQSQSQEGLGIVKLVQNYIHDGYHLDDIAILYRNNMDARVISQRFMEYNIPFKMRDTLPNIYEHWISLNIIAYFKSSNKRPDRAAFLQIMNRPKRYISRDCLDTKEVDFERLRMYYEDKYWMIQKLDQMENDLRIIRKMDPYTAINYIRHGVGYEAYLEEYAQYRKISVEDLLDVLDQIQESAKGFKTKEEWFEHIQRYGEILKEQQLHEKDQGEKITFSTLHSAKGLEYPIVFIIDVNEGIIPHKKALLQTDIEEERRLFYVGMTRASEILHICSLKEKNGKPIKDSPFLIGLKN